MITIKTFLALLFVSGLLVLAPTGCKTSDATETAVPAPARTLVNSSLIGQYSVSQLKSRYTGSSALFQIFIRYGIKAYRLEYNTTNTDGKPIKASGALLIPDV